MTTSVVGSSMPALASDALKPSKVGYGQNGFAGASSDLPHERTTSGFLPDTGPDRLADASQWADRLQKRAVSADAYSPSFGMAQRSPRNQ